MRVGRVWGIDIVVDWSWLFIFAIVASSLEGSFGPFHALDVSPATRALLAIGTALLFFVSVLLHELAHSLVARARGIPIREIRLFIFGGVSRMEAEPKTAPSAAWIASVGPMTSIALAVLAGLAANLLGLQSPGGVALGYLAAANAIVGVFNLLPAFPLDGGRVLQAIIWGKTHDRLRSTRIAVRIGAFFAWGLIAIGIISVLAGGFAGLWYTFIGWFLLQAGQSEELQARLQTALQGHSALQLATPAPTMVAANMTAEAALQLMLKGRLRALPVAIGDRLTGIVTLGDLAHVAAADLPRTYVTAVMKRMGDLKTIAPTANAIDVLRLLGETGFHQLPVVDDEGAFYGFVTREGLIDWLAHEREPVVQAVLRR